MDAFKPLFASYDVSFHPECQSAIEEATAFLESIQSQRGVWLSLLGKSGVGKTMISRIIRNYVGENTRLSSRFIKWTTAVDYMRKGDYGVIDEMKRIEVLFVDDIGAAYETQLSKAKIEEIADYRLGKPTLWTSNLSLEDVAAEIDVRVSSRMVRDGNRVVQFKDCPDWSVANYQK